MYGLSDNSELDKFSDQEIVAKTLYGEARGEGYVGQQAVANVIMNRANNPGWWGKDARSVCLKPYQFSCWLVGDPNRPIIVAITQGNSIYNQCLAISKLALTNALDDITNGAVNYKVIGTGAAWANGKQPCATIGHHDFYA